MGGRFSLASELPTSFPIEQLANIRRPLARHKRKSSRDKIPTALDGPENLSSLKLMS
jgi:hypothetical protein